MTARAGHHTEGRRASPRRQPPAGPPLVHCPITSPSHPYARRARTIIAMNSGRRPCHMTADTRRTPARSPVRDYFALLHQRAWLRCRTDAGPGRRHGPRPHAGRIQDRRTVRSAGGAYLADDTVNPRRGARLRLARFSQGANAPSTRAGALSGRGTFDGYGHGPPAHGQVVFAADPSGQSPPDVVVDGVECRFGHPVPKVVRPPPQETAHGPATAPENCETRGTRSWPRRADPAVNAILNWPAWRRRRQHQARACHYRRRGDRPPT